ncbi:MAG TPA: AEC family transporter [Propionicimonas sp.]|nr:AEC family transporter [Propionicimonas sp.]HRA05232.1 AEC family transporter [Propionicimonas sp.]
MLEIVAKALSLIAIVGIGLGIKRLGWAKPSDFKLFARLVLTVTLPCALLTSFNDYHLDRALLGLVALGLVTVVAQQVIGFLLAARRGRQQQAFAVINSGTYNIGAFGTPYLAGFMGPHAMIYSTLFDIGNAFASAGVGYGWGMALAGEPGSHRWRDTGRTLARSPVFVTYLVLLVMRLFDLRLPDAVIVFTSTVGAANPFLAMLMIGIGLELELHPSKYRAAARHLAVRYAFSIVTAIACWTLLPFPVEARLVVVMLLFAPIASMVPGFTSRAGLDVELSAFMTSVSLVVGIVMLPTLFLLLG